MKPILLCCATDAPASVKETKAVYKKIPVTWVNSMNYALLCGETLPAETFALMA